MPSKHKQAYPQRKRLKYKKDCPWEVEETPMDPEAYAQLSPRMKAYVDQKPIPIPPPNPETQRKDRPGIIHLAVLIVLCLALHRAYKMVTAMGPGDGWIDLAVGILFCGFIICVAVGGIFSILKEFLIQDTKDDSPSPPVSDKEQEQPTAQPMLDKKERERAHKLQLEKEKHQRMLKEMREDEIGYLKSNKSL